MTQTQEKATAVTRVDFYILAGNADHQERARFACRLAEKAWQQGYRVFMHTSSEFDAQQLDDLLWTFRPESFVPHAIANDPRGKELPVLVGCGEAPRLTLDVLINLTEAVPDYFGRFERLAEIVQPSDEQRASARRRYRHYREQGCGLRSHQL